MPRLAAELTTRYPLEEYETLEEALDRAEAARIPANRVADVSPVAKIPYKARDLLQVGLRRNLELAEGFIACFNQKLFTPLFVLGRASMETGCLMWEFRERVRVIVEKRDKGALIDFDQRSMNALFGAKSADWGDPDSYPAPNILTIIDRQARENPNIRRFYDTLSEFCHPNAAGMQNTYSISRPDLMETHFTDRPCDDELDGLHIPLRALILGVSQGVFAVELLETMLDEFASLCEEAIHDEGTWPATIRYPIVRGRQGPP